MIEDLGVALEEREPEACATRATCGDDALAVGRAQGANRVRLRA